MGRGPKEHGPRCECGDLLADHRRAGGDLWNIDKVIRCATNLPPIPYRPETYPRTPKNPGTREPLKDPQQGDTQYDRPFRPIEQQREDIEPYIARIRDSLAGDTPLDKLPKSVRDRIERIIDVVRKESVSQRPTFEGGREFPRQAKDIPPDEGPKPLPRRPLKDPDDGGGAVDPPTLSEDTYDRIQRALDRIDNEHNDDQNGGSGAPTNSSTGGATMTVGGGGNQKLAIVAINTRIKNAAERFTGEADVMKRAISKEFSLYSATMAKSTSQSTAIIKANLASAEQNLGAAMAALATAQNELARQISRLR